MRISKTESKCVDSHVCKPKQQAVKHTNYTWKIVLTFGGLGFSPLAPGTAGALGALLPAIIILRITDSPHVWLSGLIIGAVIVGIIGSNIIEKEWGKDSSKIVIDEAAGMWISLLFIESSWLILATAFVLFRFFDIFKPLGIRKTEQLPGGIGVMADDILAGIFANIVLHGLVYFVPELKNF